MWWEFFFLPKTVDVSGQNLVWQQDLNLLDIIYTHLFAWWHHPCTNLYCSVCYYIWKQTMWRLLTFLTTFHFKTGILFSSQVYNFYFKIFMILLNSLNDAIKQNDDFVTLSPSQAAWLSVTHVLTTAHIIQGFVSLTSRLCVGSRPHIWLKVYSNACTVIKIIPILMSSKKQFILQLLQYNFTYKFTYNPHCPQINLSRNG